MAFADYWDGYDAGVDAAIIRRPHASAIERVAQMVQGWFPRTNVYLEDRRRVGGQPGPLRRWPDLQFIHPRRHRATHVEVDTTRAGLEAHVRDHLANSRNRRGVFLQIHPRTGDIMRKVVYAAGAARPMTDERRTRTTPVQLLQRDVFDAYDD
jgi:hypothetical protein